MQLFNLYFCTKTKYPPSKVPTSQCWLLVFLQANPIGCNSGLSFLGLDCHLSHFRTLKVKHLIMFTFVYILVSEHGKSVTWQLSPLCLNEESATAVSQPQFVNHHPFNPSLAPVHSELLAMYAETIFLRSGAATKQYPEVFQDGGGVFPRSWIHRPKPTRAILPSTNHLSLYRHRLHLK